MIELEFPSEDTIEKKIKNKESFLVVKMSGLTELMKYCFLIEKIIKENHMTCRVKTKGRTLAAVPLIGLPPTWVYLGAQAIQILFTLNPDWKITRNIFTQRLEVKYCKTEVKAGSAVPK